MRGLTDFEARVLWIVSRHSDALMNDLYDASIDFDQSLSSVMAACERFFGPDLADIYCNFYSEMDD